MGSESFEEKPPWFSPITSGPAFAMPRTLLITLYASAGECYLPNGNVAPGNTWPTHSQFVVNKASLEFYKPPLIVPMSGLTWSNPDFACGFDELYCELAEAMNNHNDAADAVLIENSPMVETKGSGKQLESALARQRTMHVRDYLSFHSMPLGSNAMPRWSTTTVPATQACGSCWTGACTSCPSKVMA